MPTKKKRVNLSLSDQVYADLQEYKEKTGITNDATCCVLLITKQLHAEKENAAIMEFAKRIPLEELEKLSKLGLAQLKAEADKVE